MADSRQRGLQGMRSVFGKASSNSGESDGRVASAGISPLCPQCGSKKVWRDGLRYSMFGDRIQRWLCRGCGFRFSDSQDVEKTWSMFERLQRVDTKSLKGKPDKMIYRQIRVTKAEGTKNLAEVETREEKPTREGTIDPKLKGLMVEYLSYLEREGYSDCVCYPRLLKILGRCANLDDPKDVKQAIAKKAWKDGTKMLACYAYDAFCKMRGIQWSQPRYRQEEQIAFVPDERELEALISACRSRRMAAFLRCLKETFADPGEILGLEWINLDGNIITINKPVKGHLPGQTKVSNRLIAMLNALPKKNKRIFPTTYIAMYKCFEQVREKAALVQQNPRLNSIAFRSFRHWGGTMLAFYSKGNVMTVKRMLRHKRVESTMKYIHTCEFKDDDEFDVETATTDEDIKKLGSAGFEKYDERKFGETYISYYRRPKKFGVSDFTAKYQV